MTINQTAVCLVSNERQAERITNRLKANGFRPSEISVLLPHSHSQVARDTARGGQPGAFDWLARAGTLALPGIGCLFGAGPITAAFVGAAVIRASAGGVAGVLMTLAIPEDEAKEYEDQLRGGRILISVSAEGEEDVDAATEIFEQEGAAAFAATAIGTEGTRCTLSRSALAFPASALSRPATRYR